MGCSSAMVLSSPPRRRGKPGRWPARRLRLVPGVDPPSPVKGEGAAPAPGRSVDGLQEKAAVVAEGEALDHPAGEPVLELGEDRRAVGALAPPAAGELVHLVPGLAAEQLGQRLSL